MKIDWPEVVCPKCGTRYYENSESIVWIGYQPFHGDCLADTLIALSAQPMKRLLSPTEAAGEPRSEKGFGA